MKLIIFLAIILFSKIIFAEMIVKDNLNGKKILCENLNYENDIISNPKPLIIKDIFIKFHSDVAWNDITDETEFVAEVSYMGFIPKNFWNDITYENPIEIYANGSIDRLGNSVLTNGYTYMYSALDLSSENYIDDLPRYETTTEYIYIGHYSADRLNPLNAKEWVSSDKGGIIISRKTLEAELNYSYLHVGEYWRYDNEVKKLTCNLIDEDLQEDFYKLERRHYEINNNIKNNNVQKKLDSTKDNKL